MHDYFTVALLHDGKMNIQRFWNRLAANTFYLEHEKEPMVLQLNDGPFKFKNVEFDWKQVYRWEFSADELSRIQQFERRSKEKPDYFVRKDERYGLIARTLQQYDEDGVLHTERTLSDAFGHVLRSGTRS